MKYNDFGNTGVKISALGMGCMRLPTLEIDGKTVIDEEQAAAMVHKAYELGVNYFDSAYFYHDEQSEIVLGKAIKGIRDKINVATKCPGNRFDECGGTFRGVLEKQMKKLDVDYIDFYHLHGINYDKLYKIDREHHWIDGIVKAKEEGLIRHISFSFHGEPEDIKKLADIGVFETLLCQYNLIDRRNEEAIAYAKEKGMGIAVMGPVGGGRIANFPPSTASSAGISVKTGAEMALRFVLANPNVDCALSGMSSMEMVLENTAVATDAGPLSPKEVEMINQIMEEKKQLAKLYCTGCQYCMPCPQDVDIEYIFELMNAYRVYGAEEYAKSRYAKIGGEKWKNAVSCVECGACEEKCPQNIRIIEQLKECHKILAAN